MMVRNTLTGVHSISLIVCLAGLLTNGCVVSKNQYQGVLKEMESAKADLEKSRMVAKALEQELQKVKGENEKTAMDLEMMASEVQRIKEGRENERSLLESREEELEKKRRALVEKTKRIKREHQKVSSQNLALKSTIERYQKELKEATKRNATVATKPSTGTRPPKSQGQSASSVLSTKPKAESRPVTAPLKGALSPVNINRASANDLVLFLGLTKSAADKVVANRPYRLRGELVAKHVIPKATFNVIKDRITATR